MSTGHQNKASIGGVIITGLEFAAVTQSFMSQREERLRDESKERLGSDATRAATTRARVPYATCQWAFSSFRLCLFYQNSFIPFIKSCT